MLQTECHFFLNFALIKYIEYFEVTLYVIFQVCMDNDSIAFQKHSENHIYLSVNASEMEKTSVN